MLVYSQPFEGRIFFIKQTETDTIYYAYLVKNSMMRVDEMNQSEKVLQELNHSKFVAADRPIK